MHRRLFTFLLPLLYTTISFANDASWDCKQNKATQEWICIGDKKQLDKPEEPTLPAKRESGTESTLSAPVTSDRVKSVATDISNKSPAAAPVSDAQTQQEDILTPSSLKSIKAVTPASSEVHESTAPIEKSQTPKSVSPPSQVIKATTPKVFENTQTPKPVSPPPQAIKAAIPKVLENTQTVKPVTPPSQVIETVAPKIVENAQIPSVPAKQNVSSVAIGTNEAKESALSTTSEIVPVASANTDSRRSGWNCGGSNQSGNWDCQLVGADPAEQIQSGEANQTSIRFLSPAFDQLQEQTFRNLTAQLKYDPWQKCNLLRGTQQGYIPQSNLRESSPMDVKSNYSEIFDNEIGSYSGNVIINRADQHSISNTANYDKVSQLLDLHGDVYYREDELAVHSQTASLKLASDEAKLRDTLFISPGAPLRGSSRVVYRESKTLSRYKEVAFTSCRPGNQDWVLHASELKMNTILGKAAAKNAWMEFKGVPVLYLPYVSFPTDNRRLSGLLSPSYGHTQRSGFQFGAPYYWNIAPNYDATFRPRYLSSRGALLGANFRYLFEKTKGIVNLEYMPHDKQSNQARYLGEIKNDTIFTPNLRSNIDLNYVSDKNYFSDLGNALSIPNFNYLRSVAGINYAREGVSFSTLALSYQSVNPLIEPAQLPYQKLPQVNLNLNHTFRLTPAIPLEATMENESVNFSQQALPYGQRFNIKPSVGLPLQTASGFIKPKVSLQYTQYVLSRQPSNLPSNISRVLPILSLDSGLFFDRDLSMGNSSFQHTLEPRLFYLYIPRKNQSDIPLFDTAQYDFVYNSLFRENRFSGTDRIQDANQLSVALTSRLIDNTTGRERLRLNLGDILYFQSRKVVLSGQTVDPTWYPVESSFTSPLVAELSSEITNKISAETMMQWDPSTNKIVRGRAFMHYIDDHKKIINAGYFYRHNPLIPQNANDIVYTDLSTRWPIYDNWAAVGRWQYSLLYNRTQEGFFGFEKESCCWRFSILARHYINSVVNINGINTIAAATTAPGQAQNGIFFQIEFKGIGSFDTGAELDKFLERNINGYRSTQ